MNIKILNVRRIESVVDKGKRVIGLGNDLSHWQVDAEVDGPVKVNNLLKFNTGLKLYVESVKGNQVSLSTIREIKEIGNLTTYMIRMEHWKYGRNGANVN